MADHKHTNRLVNETSPYLLQHAHNPVDWYSWGEEALEKSKQEDKPILLSIGYSACHWCHVMEHESFENEKIAELMNSNFVNIKVDREERPDLDQIYMNAVQMMTRHGGWPLTVFLTPDLVPFYGGTYFPPEDRHQMPGFPRVLLGVSEAYRTRPEEIRQSAWEILSELRRMSVASQSNEVISAQLLENAQRGIARSYDPQHGGFGSAPKFPSSMNLEFLLRTFKRIGDARSLEMVTNSCRRMAEGGMYDQLGGGFHRYSTDARWLVPHFEKMLYDNALLSRLYLHVYQATGEEFFRKVVEETLDYVAREMRDESGAFYSTQDADSEGVEGKFFVWDKEEIEKLLGADNARLFNAYYDVTQGGNFEDSNILNIRRTAKAVAEELGVSEVELAEVVARGRRILFDAREKRIKPGRDEKVIAAWNGLMLE
ncbi:MAG TPA: thioredoxin domain-containing protein, partial [Pyrinomonadaceae bacterium]|nr:thioredoxin domain-containing protein [Pyrinomonadaceae bacterium]